MLIENISWNMEVYIDDLLVKSKEHEQDIPYLREAFGVLQWYRMKLNPTKCAFEVGLGKFLGFMVSKRGTKANPEKIQGIIDMMQSKNINEVQKLIGRIVALNEFMSRSTNKCLPFFYVM